MYITWTRHTHTDIYLDSDLAALPNCLPGPMQTLPPAFPQIDACHMYITWTRHTLTDIYLDPDFRSSSQLPPWSHAATPTCFSPDRCLSYVHYPNTTHTQWFFNIDLVLVGLHAFPTRMLSHLIVFLLII